MAKVLIVIVALLIGGALTAWAGAVLARRFRSTSAGKSLQMSLIMMGFFLDPPSRHLIEAKSETAEDEDPGGAPPTPPSPGLRG